MTEDVIAGCDRQSTYNPLPDSNPGPDPNCRRALPLNRTPELSDPGRCTCFLPYRHKLLTCKVKKNPYSYIAIISRIHHGFNLACMLCRVAVCLPALCENQRRDFGVCRRGIRTKRCPVGAGHDSLVVMPDLIGHLNIGQHQRRYLRVCVGYV